MRIGYMVMCSVCLRLGMQREPYNYHISRGLFPALIAWSLRLVNYYFVEVVL
jgi:hypothetical protein